MANDKNNNRELASTDEDPTAELEVLAFGDGARPGSASLRESDAGTFDLTDPGRRKTAQLSSTPALRSELDEQSITLGKLSYEIEGLRARSQGLEAELAARSEIIDDLNAVVTGLTDRIDRKQHLLRKRAISIKALKQEIRDRNARERELQATVDELRDSAARMERELRDQAEALPSAPHDFPVPGVIATSGAVPRGIPVPEEYADSLRRKLQDMMRLHESGEKERQMLRVHLKAHAETESRLNAELDEARREVQRQSTLLDGVAHAHAEELRMLRFELGEAQDTIVQTEELNGQLVADLVSTRGFKEELERMLCNTDEQSRQRIDALEKQIMELTQMREGFEQKLEAKSQAITALLDELAKKSEHRDATGKSGAIVTRLENRVDSDMQEDPNISRRTYRNVPGERMTRVLVGTIDNQEVRFPLFKNRLTIGRTDKNDIQLRADWVSRRHAVVITEQDTTRVIDWGSKNGVYVNSRRIKEHFLAHGDVMTIGNARFRYEERIKKDN